MRSTSPRRILLILDAFHCGETLRVMPYVKLVRDHYPAAHITLLVNENTLAAFGHAEGFDRVVVSRLYYHRPYSRFGAQFSKLQEFIGLLRQLGTGYDLVITYYWGAPLLQLLGYAVSRTGQRVAHSRFASPLLTGRANRFNRNKPHPQQHIALLRAAGIDTDQIAAPAICHTAYDATMISRLLRERGLTRSTRLVALHPGTDWPCQRWLQARWAALADEIVARYAADIVFTGSSSETGLIEGIQRYMHAPSTSLAGQTTLAQVASLFARCSLCVCVDSAIFEVTQAVGIPTVVLAGPSRPDTIVPGICAPDIVKSMAAWRVDALMVCQKLHAMAWKNIQMRNHTLVSVQCLNDRCRMAGLREIAVADVIEAVERQLLAEPGRIA